MDKDLLQKYQNDHVWAEVLRLYSGLFDTQDEREDFILDLAKKDVLLAAECKTSSMEEEENLRKKILEQSFYEYQQVKNEKTISNYCLILINFNYHDELIEIIIGLDNLTSISKRALVNVLRKISQNYKNSLVDLLNKNFYSINNIIEYFLTSLNYDIINFKEEKQNILELSNKLASTDFDLSFFYLMEKNTDYLLFEKEFVINKVKKHFENGKVFQITILWIKKYKIKSLFTDEYVLSKIIETEYWEMAFDFIENSTSIDIKKTVLEIIDSAMIKNSSIDFIIKIALQYNVLDKLSSANLIEYSLKQKNHIAFEKLIDIYYITDLEILKKGVQYFINNGKPDSYIRLIKKYSLQLVFPLNSLLINDNFILHPKAIKAFLDLYSIREINIVKMLLVEKYYNQNKLGLAINIIDSFNLWSAINFNEFIDKAFELKKWGLLTQWYSKYNIQERYTIQDIITLAIENKDINNAYSIAKEFKLNFSDFYKVSIGSIVSCSIRKIVKSRIFVKIENETRPASIYIGELAKKRTDNIFDFEYDGEKLHIGQKLIAKVIRIDEKFGIQLSLKQIKQDGE